MQGELYGISKEDYARFRAAPALEAYAEIERMAESGELYKIYTAIELASRRTWPRDFHDILA